MIGILGAMDCEIQSLIPQLSEYHLVDDGAFRWHRGKLHGEEAVIGKCGVGKVLAAASTQRLIDSFSPEALICTGVAGALTPALEIGDVVVSIDCVQHDMDATALGVPRGQIPFSDYFAIAATPQLLRAIESFPVQDFRLYFGRILSGDQFVTHQVRRSQADAFSALNGMAVEMEGAAIALVCRMNSVPFLIVRTISDRADESAAADFGALLPTVAARSCAVVEHLLRTWRGASADAP